MYGSSYCRKKSKGVQPDVQTTFALQVDTLPYEPDVTTMDTKNLDEPPHVEGEPQSEATHRLWSTCMQYNHTHTHLHI